jgi:ribonuclease P protein component
MDTLPPAMPMFEVLRGERAYGELLRSKPRFSNEQFFVHLNAANSRSPLPIDAAPPELRKTRRPVSQAALILGLIVPKKRYTLAVDRNRVKRIARAHARQLAMQPLEQPQAMLVRIKSRKKGATASAASLAQQNPHSAAFAKQLRGAMSSALQGARLVAPVAPEKQAP